MTFGWFPHFQGGEGSHLFSVESRYPADRLIVVDRHGVMLDPTQACQNALGRLRAACRPQATRPV